MKVVIDWKEVPAVNTGELVQATIAHDGGTVTLSADAVEVSANRTVGGRYRHAAEAPRIYGGIPRTKYRLAWLRWFGHALGVDLVDYDYIMTRLPDGIAAVEQRACEYLAEHLASVEYRLRSAREAQGQTQEEAAQDIGVSWTTVSRWENGHMEPTGRNNIKAVEDYIRKAKKQA